MAVMPDVPFSGGHEAFIYKWSAKVDSIGPEATTMNTSNTDFRKALDGMISARNREATRQVVRNNEFQLIGALTKRPN